MKVWVSGDKMNTHQAKSQGFTLVELSMVIIIISFLIAGISAGQSLVKQAALNSVITEQSSIVTGLNNFKLIYGGLPGDIDYASSYWPNCDPTPAKCNGDNNGKIEFTFNPGFSGDYAAMESFRAWQQMSDAKLIPGSYSGKGGTPGYQATAGINIPPTKLMSNAGYFLTIYDLSSVNVAIGLAKETPGIDNLGAVLSPTEIYNIDQKIDDGVPTTGIIRAFHQYVSGNGFVDDCFTGATYNLTLSGPRCLILYIYSQD